MKKNSAIMVSATVIFLALLLPYPSVAETLLAPRTTTTQPTTTTTNPTVVQQPTITPRPTDVQPVGSIQIYVRDSYDNPVSAATIEMRRVPFGEASYAVIPGTYLTDDRGSAFISGLDMYGYYAYSVKKAGYYPSIQYMNFKPMDTTTILSKYIMIKYGSAKVKVIDNGVAVAGAMVNVAVNNRLLSATTDAGGMASFGNLPPGRYSFSVKTFGYTDNLATAIVASGQEANVPIAISALTGGLAVTVKSGATLLAGAVVNAIPFTNSVIPGTTSQSAVTNSRGIAIFSNSHIGYYDLNISKTGYTGYIQTSSRVYIYANQTTQVVYDMISQP